MNSEISPEKVNNSSNRCIQPQDHQQHPYHLQRLKSNRPTLNWYIGRRPRTAFTNSQVVNHSQALHLRHSKTWYVLMVNFKIVHLIFTFRWMWWRLCFRWTAIQEFSWGSSWRNGWTWTRTEYRYTHSQNWLTDQLTDVCFYLQYQWPVFL